VSSKPTTPSRATREFLKILGQNLDTLLDSLVDKVSNIDPSIEWEELMLRQSISACVLVIAMLLQGCVGIGGWVPGDQSQTFDYPYLGVGEWKGHVSSARLKALNLDDANTLEKYWGKPDRRLELGKGTEQWQYRLDRLRWRGAFIFVFFIPVPLLIPIGHDYVTLLIQEGQVLSAKKVTGTTKGEFFCGFAFADKGSGPVCAGRLEFDLFD